MVYNLVSLKPAHVEKHPSFFDDTIDAVAVAIERAGHQVIKTTNRIAVDAVNIVWGVGTHLFPSIANFRSATSPKNTIVFNMEQIGSDSALITEEYLSLLKDYVVLDYNQSNIDSLNCRTKSLCCAFEFPVRPALGLNQCSDEVDHLDCDGLFYGALSPRRLQILQNLQSKGLRVRIAQGFGEELSRQIIRSKFVLNIHLHDTAVFEVARVLRPISHGVPVLSEASVLPSTVSWVRSGVRFYNDDEFVERCREFLLNHEEFIKCSREAFRFGACFDDGVVDDVLGKLRAALG